MQSGRLDDSNRMSILAFWEGERREKVLLSNSGLFSHGNNSSFGKSLEFSFELSLTSCFATNSHLSLWGCSLFSEVVPYNSLKGAEREENEVGFLLPGNRGEETASGCAGGDLGWILEKCSSWKGL